MAGQSKRQSRDGSSDLEMLDELIRRSFKELLATIGENVKIGDFIKMLETRHKLTPAGADQREFWSMLEKIRRDTLTGEDKNAQTNNNVRRKGRRSGKGA